MNSNLNSSRSNVKRPVIENWTEFYASSAPHKNIPWVINQNDKYKIGWDIFIMAILVLIIVVMPARIAFVESEPLEWQIAFYAVDFLFLIDIILWFFTSYTDPYKQIEITSHKNIAINYTKTWFFIDFLSTFPIDAIMTSHNLNDLFRFARIGKIYKLIRLFRLMKVFKLIKGNKKLMTQFSERLRINSGTERLVFFSFFFGIFLHVSTCLFIMLGSLSDEDEPASWLDLYQDMKPHQVYIVSAYYVITTTSTVGYGDISPENTYERLYGCALMLIGVISFTFISGALSSILSSYDIKQAAL